MGTIHFAGQAEPAAAVFSKGLTAGQAAPGFLSGGFRINTLLQLMEVILTFKLML
jgi:hypothetical protein